jgi:16S rRNA G966 N2-methylase RsmD
LGDICSLEIADARSFLGRCHSSFDVIFVDPPFADNGLLETAVTAICELRLMSQWLYLEFDQQQEATVNALLLRHGLSLAKSTKAGSTRSWLVQAQ